MLKWLTDFLISGTNRGRYTPTGIALVVQLTRRCCLLERAGWWVHIEVATLRKELGLRQLLISICTRYYR